MPMGFELVQFTFYSFIFSIRKEKIYQRSTWFFLGMDGATSIVLIVFQFLQLIVDYFEKQNW
jgi:hypothetical protein